MKYKNFFTRDWFRSDLLEELGLPLERGSSKESDRNGSFDQLRHKVAIKWFGKEVVNSKAFKRAELRHQIKVIQFCLARDQRYKRSNDREFGLNRFKYGMSLLPDLIAENKQRLKTLKAQL